MSDREMRRAAILEQVKTGAWTLVDAAERMEISYRQAKRLWKRYEKKAAAGLVHGNAGRESNRSKPKKVRKKAVRLIREKYSGEVGERFGPTLAAEHLFSEDQMELSVTTVRRWMLAEGLWAWPRAKWEQLADRRAWAVVVGSAFLIGAGSGYYHWSPDNLTLFWDRLPMTLGFMGVFSAVIAERVHARVGYFLLGPFLVLGILSVEVWRQDELTGVGDLRFYALVQFYPMLAIPLMLWLYRSRYTHSSEIWRMVIWYVAAKLLEMFDREIWALTGSQMSGHALKHVAAAIALWMPLRMIAHRDVERKSA